MVPESGKTPSESDSEKNNARTQKLQAILKSIEDDLEKEADKARALKLPDILKSNEADIKKIIEPGPKPNSEEDKKREQELLISLKKLEDGYTKSSNSPLKAFWKILTNLHRIGSMAVLRSRIKPFQSSWEQKKAMKPPRDEEDVRLYATVTISLKKAIEKLDQYDIDMAGAYWHLANRMDRFIDLRDTIDETHEKERAMQADLLLILGRKTLNATDKEVLEKVLTDGGKRKDKVSTDDLDLVGELIDQESEAVRFKLNSIQVQLIVLSTVVFLASIAVLLILSFTNLNSSLSNFWFVLAVALFGALGGSISGIFTFAKITMKEELDIPMQRLSAWLTMMRPLVGAASALVISIFVQSGLVNFGTVSAYQLLAVSFAAGWSERLITGAVDKTGK